MVRLLWEWVGSAFKPGNHKSWVGVFIQNDCPCTRPEIVLLLIFGDVFVFSSLSFNRWINFVLE